MTATVALTCPECGVRLRIKARHAHLRGRCPECTSRIQPPRPAAQPERRRPSAGFDEPAGLVEIEDEWPEPAQVEETEDADGYGLAAMASPEPPAIRAEQILTPSPDEETYRLSDEPAPHLPPAPEPEEETYGVGPVDVHKPTVEELVTYQLSDAELNPVKASPPPALPLWNGIYTFPGRPECLRPMLFLSGGYCIIAWVAAAVVMLSGVLGGSDVSGDPMGSRLVAVGVVGLLLVFVWFFTWTSSFAASCFLAVVEDTTGGSEKVEWPEGGWRDYFWKYFYLLWLLLCAVAIPGVLLKLVGFVVPMANEIYGLLVGGFAVVLFPIVLLSALTGDSPWSVFDLSLVSRLFQQPRVAAMLIVHTGLVAVPCLWLGWLVIAEGHFVLGPVLAVVWAGGLLSYGRAVGRVAWTLTREEQAKQRAEREARRRATETR